ncbi:MAG: glycosyltransferase family 2 protein [Candidatus Omnitrophota bacterium]
MRLAPIALFVYNRVFFAKRTIEALQKNLLAGESDLFVFSDGPKSNYDEKRVSEMREFLRKVDGFKKIEIIEKDTNLGLAESIISGVTEIVNMRDRVIVLEDDLDLSPYFLKFMNEALELYSNEDRVSSVCGHFFGVTGKIPETFFLKMFSSYGWATWKRAWGFFEKDGKKLLRKLEELKCGKAFDMNGMYPFMRTLKKQSTGLSDAWAARWYASSYLRNSLNLFPGRSLVDHIGIAPDSSHNVTPYAKLYSVNMSDRPIVVEKVKPEEDPCVVKIVEEHMKRTMPNVTTRAFYKLQRFFYSARKSAKNIISKWL